MRIFVYEYTCATADASLSPSLRTEGAAMLSAVMADLIQVRGVEAVTLLGEGFEGSVPGEVRRCAPTAEPATFRALAGSADYTLVIAPEFDGILAERCRWVLQAGGRLLGPAPTAVQLTADKLRLANLWRGQRVPTPPCDRGEPGGAEYGAKEMRECGARLTTYKVTAL